MARKRSKTKCGPASQGIWLTLEECEQAVGGTLPPRVAEIALRVLTEIDHWHIWAGRQLSRISCERHEGVRFWAATDWNARLSNMVRSVGKRARSKASEIKKSTELVSDWTVAVNRMERRIACQKSSASSHPWDTWAANKAALIRHRADHRLRRENHSGQ